VGKRGRMEWEISPHNGGRKGGTFKKCDGAPKGRLSPKKPTRSPSGKLEKEGKKETVLQDARGKPIESPKGPSRSALKKKHHTNWEKRGGNIPTRCIGPSLELSKGLERFAHGL